MTNDIKKTLGETTEQVENKIRDVVNNYHPYYSKLEPYQRGLILIALTTFLILTIYYLTKKEKSIPRELTETERKRIEALAEERILKRAEFLKRLQ